MLLSFAAAVPLLVICVLGLHRVFLLRHALDAARVSRAYITRAFLYPRGTLIDADALVARGPVVVILVTADRRWASAPPAVSCATATGSNETRGALQALHVGYSHAPCRLAIFRIVCRSPLLPPFPENALIGLHIEGFRGLIKLNLTMADQTARQLVICPGRMFLFDQWQLLLVSLELCRAHRVDLVLARVHSVHPALLPLLAMYERTGLLRVRPSLRLPAGDPDFEPNAETLWNNQLVDFHDCLYEFRESASFVAFPDWDDLLITPASTPLPSSLHAFVATHPAVAALIPKRFPGKIPTLAQMHSRQMGDNIGALFRPGGIRFSVWPADAQFISKVLIRPALVTGVGLHAAGAITRGYRSAELPPEHAFFVHARDYENPRMGQHLPSGHLLARNLAQLLREYNVSLLGMPRAELFLGTLNACLARVESRVKANRHSKCFNYAQCRRQLEQRTEEIGGLQCLGAQNRWRVVHAPVAGRNSVQRMRVHVLVQEALVPLRGVQCLP